MILWPFSSISTACKGLRGARAINTAIASYLNGVVVVTSPRRLTETIFRMPLLLESYLDGDISSHTWRQRFQSSLWLWNAKPDGKSIDTWHQGLLYFSHGIARLALYQESKWLEERTITHVRKATTPKEAGSKFRICLCDWTLLLLSC